MPDVLAKGVAATVAALLAIVVAILLVTSSPTTSGAVVTAEFDDAFPLIEGMHVRVDGAIAGTVGAIEVNDRGNAEVELNLNGSVEPATANATAAIRQQDTTGDSYVAFDPGDADAPLDSDAIVCESHDRCGRTLVAPRLDDLLNAFGPSERAGVQLILVELAKALDRRGGDLNEAALELRPAIESANEALAQVRGQNAALGELIESAESVSGQAARRDAELAGLIDSLATTVEVTAAEATPLDAALKRLPETATQARTTLSALTSSAIEARPLADRLAAGAPELAVALDRLPGFLDHASGFLDDTRPTVRLTRRVLADAEPTLKVGKRRVITGPFDLTGAVADLLNAVLGGEDAFPALFDDDSYGEGEGTLGKRGFGSVAVEPGNLPPYPAGHADRNWLRVSAVMNCEVFGVPVEPGCLARVLAGSAPGSDTAAATGRSAPPPSADDGEVPRGPGAGSGDGGSGGEGRPDGGRPDRGGSGGGGSGPGGGGPKLPEPKLPKLPGVDLSGLGKKSLGDRAQRRAAQRAGGGRRGGRTTGPRRPGPVGNFLDYLLDNG
jgi:virulence factor Mce-like protein